MIYTANQMTGFYMRTTLAFNELRDSLQISWLTQGWYPTMAKSTLIYKEKII